MTKIALIFPGQGAQYVGMGKEFYEKSKEAKLVFDEADRTLKIGLTDVILNGPAEKLTSTAYCQPAILTFSMAALKALQDHPKFKNFEPQFCAGLSLGEYSALAAAGALTLEDALRLVERRAAFMEEAAKLETGKMAAIIGLAKEKIVEICAQAGAQVANFNSPQQIVITGQAEKVEKASKLLKDAGAKSVIPLDVSGAFHSTLMEPAAEKFKSVLALTEIQIPKITVLSNVNGSPETTPDQIRGNLAQQITSSVQWVATIEYIAGQGITEFIEIGPGKVLAGLIRRTNPSLKTYNIEKPEDIEKL